MPELSNIQTFEKINGIDFAPTFERFKKVLLDLNLWNDDVEKGFDRFEWDGTYGFAYSDIPASINKWGIEIKPNILGYTPDLDDAFKENWLQCDLLIEAEKLRSFKTGEFHEQTYNIVKSLCLAMQKEFHQTGVYFTDEAQDGEDFDGIRCRDANKLWQFDYALIPNSLIPLYSDIPNTHVIKQHEYFMEAWYISRWNVNN